MGKYNVYMYNAVIRQLSVMNSKHSGVRFQLICLFLHIRPQRWRWGLFVHRLIWPCSAPRVQAHINRLQEESAFSAAFLSSNLDTDPAATLLWTSSQTPFWLWRHQLIRCRMVHQSGAAFEGTHRRFSLTSRHTLPRLRACGQEPLTHVQLINTETTGPCLWC